MSYKTERSWSQFQPLFPRESLESSPDVQKGGSIPTTTNTAYEMMKLRGQDGPEYEVVSVPSETSPSLAKTADEMPSLPPSHQPLPAIPLPEAPSGGVGVWPRKRRKRVCMIMITSQEISDYMWSQSELQNMSHTIAVPKLFSYTNRNKGQIRQ